ncbi:metallophosphoesterase family protein [Cytobacillus firmus]|uniref:metallophosphoesterase family protein n=1 Tax=Cytobacillus firmus TaxID=1399 RepID=UPI0024C1A2EF|nr:metallophosphoesterase family protein [Cytobacillus firmus]WHY61111.1 metallophosphoesterase family protein [Cytobacillus firmus]
MKLAFISDIHGNAVALDAVLQDIKEKNVDKAFVLGDICFRGPEPKRALDIIRSLECDVIKGNADEWVVRGVREGEVPSQVLEMMNKERDWTYSKLDAFDISYLGNLPSELELEFAGKKIHAFHATPKNLFEIIPQTASGEVIKEKLLVKEVDIYIYAHIHKPYIRYINGKCLINIGSVGLPFDGLNKASYCIVEINNRSYQTSIVRVDFNVNKVIEQYKDLNYPNAEMLSGIVLRGKV